MIPLVVAEHFARHHAHVPAEAIDLREVFVPGDGWVEASVVALPDGWTMASFGYDGKAVADFSRRELEASPVPAEHPATRTSKPYVLVADGRIVGYADSKSVAVMRRAHKLHAMVVAVAR